MVKCDRGIFVHHRGVDLRWVSREDFPGPRDSFHEILYIIFRVLLLTIVGIFRTKMKNIMDLCFSQMYRSCILYAVAGTTASCTSLSGGKEVDGLLPAFTSRENVEYMNRIILIRSKSTAGFFQINSKAYSLFSICIGFRNNKLGS